MEVAAIDKKVAADLVVKFHYLHRKPPISFAYGLLIDGTVVGVITFGCPASFNIQKGACPSNPAMVTELNRFWVSDEMPKNTGSWFGSRVLSLLPARIVVSYADTREGHVGYIYRALNFKYAGWTDMERKTPRCDYIPNDPSKHSREASRSGVASKVRRKPKVKYWITTGNHGERKKLSEECRWPSLDWKTQPPPTEIRDARHKMG